MVMRIMFGFILSFVEERTGEGAHIIPMEISIESDEVRIRFFFIVFQTSLSV
jgi:hypothetical protein